ncbi:hypothetical protein RIF29_21445 [Crotalaria pallida]|uniref:Uncharacterized protein n=1 Tax=Crotalaria pallida TaxID=3830 RepID=A0AAN9F305_CROPI
MLCASKAKRSFCKPHFDHLTLSDSDRVHLTPHPPFFFLIFKPPKIKKTQPTTISLFSLLSQSFHQTHSNPTTHSFSSPANHFFIAAAADGRFQTQPPEAESVTETRAVVVADKPQGGVERRDPLAFTSGVVATTDSSGGEAAARDEATTRRRDGEGDRDVQEVATPGVSVLLRSLSDSSFVRSCVEEERRRRRKLLVG